ncbi:cytochrome P450 [Frankia sp. AgB32]|uniref:cytochrome P450 n=1 Tax=Frankia sp. AgB32 TaxID=631119 RepID=UPI00200FFFFA|nr:cytochrome P450 [Frankia sp. AgB32]MCK9894527.1 cytochrome P450 [Frankia sp. AgB32]
MTTLQALNRDRLKELFDLRSSYNSLMGGDFQTDPYPLWARLRAEAPVHDGTVHKLSGYPGEAFFQGLPFPDQPHFSAFTFAACDAALRDEVTFASSPAVVDGTGEIPGFETSMLSMNGAMHRRYRALVQPSFVPAKAGWWITKWIEETVQLLVDGLVDQGRAELNVDFCAAIPILTITHSFGIPIEQALEVRASLGTPAKIAAMLAPIVAARREDPQDDLISVLVQAELRDEDGVNQRLSDLEIYSFAILLLLAGSGTTWKQMGIVLTALLERPELLAAVRSDRSLLRPAIEEALRWTPTDPMFSRHVTRDTEFFGKHLPAGSVLHLCLGAANRDPARWDRPDEFDPRRPVKRSLGFGGGFHICLGMHVARAEMLVGIGALLDRLPNLRLDPDGPQPRYIGMYERGATEIPVVFG